MLQLIVLIACVLTLEQKHATAMSNTVTNPQTVENSDPTKVNTDIITLTTNAFPFVNNVSAFTTGSMFVTDESTEEPISSAIDLKNTSSSRASNSFQISLSISNVDVTTPGSASSSSVGDSIEQTNGSEFVNVSHTSEFVSHLGTFTTVQPGFESISQVTSTSLLSDFRTENSSVEEKLGGTSTVQIGSDSTYSSSILLHSEIPVTPVGSSASILEVF